MPNQVRARESRVGSGGPAELERDMRAEPGAVLGDVLRRTGGAYGTTTRLTPKFREDIREIEELTSDDELLRASPRLRRRHALPPDPGIMLHFDEVPFPDAPGRFWGAFRWEPRASGMPGRA